LVKSAVVTRAGRRSTHRAWLQSGTPEFDLILVAYETLPDTMVAGAKAHILIPGAKVAGWSSFFNDHPQVFQQYNHIALLDDDLVCSARDINMSFRLGRKYGLSLWQPSLSWRSYFSYSALLHNPLYQLRYVNFVEMMCPFFTAEHLQRCLPIFGLGLETGVDRLWCRLRKESRWAYAVIDCVQVEHNKPVGLHRAAQGFSGTYRDVHDKLEADLKIPFRGVVAYGAISRGGRKLQGKWRMALGALVTLAAFGQTPHTNLRWFFRRVLDHVRHNLTRPINNDEIALPTKSEN
jgi:hypothetical protein